MATWNRFYLGMLLACAVVALTTVAWMLRWQLLPSGDGAAYAVDRLTGQIWYLVGSDKREIAPPRFVDFTPDPPAQK